MTIVQHTHRHRHSGTRKQLERLHEDMQAGTLVRPFKIKDGFMWHTHEHVHETSVGSRKIHDPNIYAHGSSLHDATDENIIGRREYTENVKLFNDRIRKMATKK